MAYMIKLTAEYRWVPDGGGGAMLGQAQADNAGYGSAGMAGTVGAAQAASDIIGEFVSGGDTPTSANFSAALSAGAADLAARFVSSGAVPGFAPTGTLFAVVSGWAGGNP